MDYGLLDYRKAFDSVSHTKLIEKLLLLNVDPSLIKWIAAFLPDRKMRVKVKLEFSDWIVILSGVPQGSVLGRVRRNTAPSAPATNLNPNPNCNPRLN